MNENGNEKTAESELEGDASKSKLSGAHVTSHKLNNNSLK